MVFKVEACCISNKGKIRSKNEDNIVFNDKCMDVESLGLDEPEYMCFKTTDKKTVALFDGMGGEKYGEYASYYAALKMLNILRDKEYTLMSEREYIENIINELDKEVNKYQEQMFTNNIGTTIVSLYFSGDYVFTYNVGDSKAFRYRDGNIIKLSKCHVDEYKNKQFLTQYLGYGDYDHEVVPFINKEKVQKGDIYLLCSDGLTDMLLIEDILNVLKINSDLTLMINELLNQALLNGGKDNISIIICRIGGDSNG